MAAPPRGGPDASRQRESRGGSPRTLLSIRMTGLLAAELSWPCTAPPLFPASAVALARTVKSPRASDGANAADLGARDAETPSNPALARGDALANAFAVLGSGQGVPGGH